MRKTLRVRREQLGMSVTRIAEMVGHDIAVVSKAINHGRYPRVIAKVRGVLGV